MNNGTKQTTPTAETRNAPKPADNTATAKETEMTIWMANYESGAAYPTAAASGLSAIERLARKTGGHVVKRTVRAYTNEKGLAEVTCHIRLGQGMRMVAFATLTNLI